MLILIFSQKQYKVRPQHLFTVKVEFRGWMPGVMSGVVGSYGWWLMEWDVEALWASSSDEVPEAALLDTFHMQVAHPLAKRSSALDQTDGNSE